MTGPAGVFVVHLIAGGAEVLKYHRYEGKAGREEGGCQTHLVQTLLAGHDGIVVPTEITLGRHRGTTTAAVTLASPVLRWPDLLIV